MITADMVSQFNFDEIRLLEVDEIRDKLGIYLKLGMDVIGKKKQKRVSEFSKSR